MKAKKKFEDSGLNRIGDKKIPNHVNLKKFNNPNKNENNKNNSNYDYKRLTEENLSDIENINIANISSSLNYNGKIKKKKSISNNIRKVSSNGLINNADQSDNHMKNVILNKALEARKGIL